MSIHVDLNLNNKKPNYKNLLIIGSSYGDCLNNGFPKNNGLEKLYTVSDSTAAIINQLTDNQLVGIITYQCMGFDIYYVKDTLNIRSNLNKMFENNFTKSKNYVILRKDKSWDYYFDYLYPDDVSDDFFTDHQYLNELALQGDNLLSIRAVNHYFNFKSIKHRADFIDKIEELDYAIDSITYKKEEPYPYKLQISKQEFIDPKTLKVTSNILKFMSWKAGGQYQGWGAEIKTQD